MNDFTRDWSASTWVAASTLVIALALDAVLLLHRPTVEETPVLALPSPTPIRVQPIEGADSIRDAANHAPFGGTAASPMLQSAANGMMTRPLAPAPVVRPRLLGTVVEQDGGFVVLEMPDARVQVVRVGERAGEMRLRSVAAGEAVFDDPRDGRITLRTSPPERPDTRP